MADEVKELPDASSKLPGVIEDYKKKITDKIVSLIDVMKKITTISFDDVVEGIVKCADALSSAIGTVLKGSLKGIAVGAVNVTKGIIDITSASLKCNASFVNGMQSMSDSASSLAGTVVGPLAEGITNTLLPIATDSMAQLGTAFEEGGLAGMLTTGASIMTSLASSLSENLPLLVDTLTTMITGFIPIIEENLPIIIEAGMQMLLALIQGIGEMLPSLLEMAVQIFVSLVEGLASQLPTLIPIAIEAILTILNALIENLPVIIEAGIDILLALVDGFVNAIPLLIEKMPELIEKIWNAITESLPKILEAGKNILTKLIDGIVENGPQLLESAKEIVDNLIKKFKETDWLQIGKDILEGIINGIGNMVDWAVGKVVEACGDIKDSFLDFFGIASPSKVMRDEVGKFLPKGIEIGFTTQLPKSMKSIKSSLQVGLDQMRNVALANNIEKSGLSITSDYRMNAQNVVTYQVDQTINSATSLSPSEISLETENTIRRLKWSI